MLTVSIALPDTMVSARLARDGNSANHDALPCHGFPYKWGRKEFLLDLFLVDLNLWFTDFFPQRSVLEHRRRQSHKKERENLRTLCELLNPAVPASVTI